MRTPAHEKAIALLDDAEKQLQKFEEDADSFAADDIFPILRDLLIEHAQVKAEARAAKRRQIESQWWFELRVRPIYDIARSLAYALENGHTTIGEKLLELRNAVQKDRDEHSNEIEYTGEVYRLRARAAVLHEFLAVNVRGTLADLLDALDEQIASSITAAATDQEQRKDALRDVPALKEP